MEAEPLRIRSFPMRMEKSPLLSSPLPPPMAQDKDL